MIKLGSNNIGKIYLGNNVIGKAYLGSNLVYQKGSSPQPTAIPYIRGGANGSYINTGITPNNTTRVIVWARNVNPGFSYLFGCRVSASSSRFFFSSFYTDITTGRINIQVMNNGTASSPCSPELFTEYHKYEINNGKLLIDDVELASVQTSTFSYSNNIHLFGLNNNGTHWEMACDADICACKIYNNGVLVRDFTPVESPSIGFYDSVSDSVFTNAGTGSFSYGTFYPGSYTRLEYVESAGGAYADIGIYGSNSLDYVSMFVPKLEASWPWYFGCQTSSSSKRYGIAFGDSTTVGRQLLFLYANSLNSFTKSSSFNNLNCIVSKYAADHYCWTVNSDVTTQQTKQTFTASTFTTDYTIVFPGSNQAGSKSGGGYIGRIYYARFGNSRNLVPAKVNNAIGLYDTYNDTFYQSETSEQFVAGPEV